MSFINVSPEEFLDKMKGAFVIRAPTSYKRILEGTDLVIEEDGDINSIPKDKEARILVYCRRGNSSAGLSQYLSNLGYNNVINLAGGMHALEEIEAKGGKKA